LAAASDVGPPSKLSRQQGSSMNSVNTVSSSATETFHDGGQ
jgi:hypothetical protein